MRRFIFFLILTLALTGCQKGDDGTGAPAVGTQTTEPAPHPQTDPLKSDDHQVGNGGGGVCVGGICMTLAEAGLRIESPSDDSFLLTHEMIDAVEALLKRLPLADVRKNLLNSIIGNGYIYKKIDVIDPQKLEVIRQRYAQILLKYGSSIDPRSVQIFAFASQNTSNAVTYLLPAFFNLTVSQQAKVLLHENYVRRNLTEAEFAAVLEFDGMVEDLLAKPSLLMQPDFRFDRWDAFVGGREITYWVARLYATQGTLLDLTKICGPHHRDIDSCTPDVPLASRNYDLPAAFVKRLTAYSRNWGCSLWSVPVLDSSKAPPVTNEIREKCEANLKGKEFAPFFYTYKTSEVDYQLARIVCYVEKDKIMFELSPVVPLCM